MPAVFKTSTDALCLARSTSGWEQQAGPSQKALQASVKMGRKLLEGFDHRREESGCCVERSEIKPEAEKPIRRPSQ